MSTEPLPAPPSGALERVIAFTIAHRWLMLALTLALVAVGTWSFRQLPIDVTPDITNVQVQVNTAAPGYSPLEAEQRVTFPLETALADIHRLLDQGAAERSGTAGAEPAGEHEESIVQRLAAAERHFEQTHPTLAGVLGSVIDALARMGI